MKIRTILPDLQRNRTLCYLAAPYTSRATRNGEFDSGAATAAAHDAKAWLGCLAAHGVSAISPIVMAHEACVIPALRSKRTKEKPSDYKRLSPSECRG